MRQTAFICSSFLVLMPLCGQAVAAERLSADHAPTSITWEKRRTHDLVARFDPASKLYWALPEKYDPKRLAQLPRELAAKEKSCEQLKERLESTPGAYGMRKKGQADPNQALLDSIAQCDKALEVLYGLKEHGQVQAASQLPRYTFGNARAFGTRLVVDGQMGWHLPLSEEVKRANPAFSLFESDHGMLREPGSQTCARGIPVYGLTNQTLAFCWPSDEAMPMVLVRSRTAYDEIIEAPDQSDDAKLEALTQLALAQSTTDLPQAPVPPAQPAMALATKLDKGEFETTEDFRKRESAETLRVSTLNAATQRAHEARLKRHEADLAAHQRKVSELQADSAKPEALRAKAAQAASRAMALLYGDPILSEFRYDADRQVFAGKLRSEKGNFQRQIEFSVPIKDAPQMKAKLSDTRAIPLVTFAVQWPKLDFAKLDIVDNVFKMQRDFAAAQQTHTLAAYQAFITLNPGAPQVAQAEKGIREIQAREEKERKAHAEEERAQERERQANAAADAARLKAFEKRGCSDFYPGKTGKIAGKVVFFFSTEDAYVVRYVNPAQRMVTIQGTAGGAALKDGQMHEISCLDLLWSSR